MITYSIIQKSQLEGGLRLDAEYFQPRYKQILNMLKNGPNDKLINNFSIIRSRPFPYKENGEIRVIQTKQLGKEFINQETEERTTQKILETVKLPLLQDKDVVFASMGVGSLGKTNIIYDFEISTKNFTIDSTLRIFRKKSEGKILPEVLMIFFNSNIGQQLIYKYIVGTSGIISIYEDYLRNFTLPVLKTETQQKIVDLVRKSHEAKKKSQEFLEEAKRKVEEMIEKETCYNTQ